MSQCSIQRKRKLKLNTTSSLIFQITVVVCGFILPRFILSYFGSEINGLVNSIMQFLQLIGFLELGVGAVVQSSLYKPLADKDKVTISKIIASADKFFKTLAKILLAYVIGLTIFYPFIVDKNFSWIYTATLILAISISMFAQYYFGIVNQLLITADQRGYLSYTAQTLTLIINTVACVILIKLGASIQIVKLTTSIIYLGRPIFLHVYVDRHYKIDRKIEYDEEPIKQKWNGIAQHVAAVILGGTDNIVLTLFSTLSNVSIYSVYFMVVNGVKTIILSLTNGLQSLMGELWARREIDNLTKTFSMVEWAINTATTIVFTCTAILIVPFVQVYTRGINDANYTQPLFAVLITIAFAMNCIRLPYNMMILAGGHYKQTQRNYIVAAIVNICVSVAMVSIFGLIGVAIGTLAALLYQTIWMAWYNSNNFINWPMKSFLKQFLVDAITFVCGYVVTLKIQMIVCSWIGWILLSAEVFLIVLGIVIIINLICYRKNVKFINNKIKKGIRHREGKV